jgi:hypothetical protein
VAQYTDAVMRARSLAVARLHEDLARFGAEGCVGSDVGMQVWTTPCSYRSGMGERDQLEDHVVQFFAVSTGVIRYSAGQEPERPQLMIRLEDRRNVSP